MVVVDNRGCAQKIIGNLNNLMVVVVVVDNRGCCSQKIIGNP